MCKAFSLRSLFGLCRVLRRSRSQATASRAKVDAVPAGHVAVWVGGAGASHRFVMRLAHLNHPAFRELLMQAEEEYGFTSTSGPIALPCDEAHFLDVLRRASPPKEPSYCSRRRVISNSESRALLHGMPLEKLVY